MLPNCFCTEVPTILTMTSCNETVDFGLWRAGTLTYQFAPAGYPGAPTVKRFYGDQEFHDLVAEAANPTFGPVLFRYLLKCSPHTAGFTIGQVYASSPYGSPYDSGVAIASWNAPTAHNSCNPYVSGGGAPSLSLADFVPFPGADPLACCTIYGGAAGAPANCYGPGSLLVPTC